MTRILHIIPLIVLAVLISFSIVPIAMATEVTGNLSSDGSATNEEGTALESSASGASGVVLSAAAGDASPGARGGEVVGGINNAAGASSLNHDVIWWSIVPLILVGIGVYYFLARRRMRTGV